MRSILFLARKYLFLRKNSAVVNILSFITAVSMAIGSASLIVVLSVFNGFETLAISLYEDFEPSLSACPSVGKSGEIPADKWQKIVKLPNVKAVSGVYESKAYFRYGTNEAIAVLKGVDADYFRTNSLKKHIIAGDTLLEGEDISYALVGLAVADKLELDVNESFETLEIYAPKVSNTLGLSGNSQFEVSYTKPRGVFSIYQEYDDKFVIVPLQLAQYLNQTNENTITALEIKIDQNLESTKEKIQEILGNEWTVKDRLEKNETLYKLTKVEKTITYLVMAFILLILSMNFVGSLTMHYLEKQSDLKTLLALGFSAKKIGLLYQSIGVWQGMLGGIFGLVIGILILGSQLLFGWLQMPGSGTFVVNSYPVEIRMLDILSILLLVFLVSWTMSWLPASRAKKSLEVG